MDANLLKLLFTWSGKLGVGSALLVFLAVSIYTFAPTWIESQHQVMNGADTQITALQKLYYYNEYTVNNFKGILAKYDVEDKEQNKLILYAARNVVDEGIVLATNELDRLPSCMPNVGEFIRESLDDDEMRNEVVGVVGRPDLDNNDRYDFAEEYLKSYQRKSVNLLYKEIKGMKKCEH